MKRAKHTTNVPVSCPACITLAEQKRMPWHGSWLNSLLAHADEIYKIHNKAIRKEQPT